ncbi:hypothetical protein [Flavobacterium sp. N502536]|uniref:hypothetical protein n=1 Tax=Flavobacterium sp. N502536 TaxID=2986837 RepID=UPI0022215FD4|nr:hypothetical protein [Flavobacterium sp. N502536]
MKKSIFSLLILCGTALTYISCSNNDDKNNQSDVSTVGASIAIDATNEMDIKTGLIVSAKNTTTTKSNETTPGICATITIAQQNAASYPKVFTVDYGTTGCADNQITRKGKLKITLSGPIITTGSKMTIERIDYSINGVKLEGTIEYTNTTTVATVPQWTRKVTNGKFTDLIGRVYLSSGTWTVKQTTGVDTPYVLEDNTYEMTEGNHTITTSSGTTLTLTVQESLIKKYACEFVSKGKLKVQGGLLNGVVDYGNNECDGKFTYTHENGTAYNLSM